MKTYRLCMLATLFLLGSAMAFISCNNSDPFHNVTPVPEPPNMDPLVNKPFDQLFGLSYPEWMDAWIKTVPANSCSNTTDESLSVTQDASGRVTFVSSGNRVASTRTITVDESNYLFFPIVNTISTDPCLQNGDNRPKPGESMEDFLKRQASAYIDKVSSLKVNLDGLPYTTPFLHRYVTSDFQIFNNRVLGDCFDACIMQDTVQDAVSEGYWIMLKPMSGEHTLNLKAEVTGYGVVTDVTYHIIAR